MARRMGRPGGESEGAVREGGAAPRPGGVVAEEHRGRRATACEGGAPTPCRRYRCQRHVGGRPHDPLVHAAALETHPFQGVPHAVNRPLLVVPFYDLQRPAGTSYLVISAGQCFTRLVALPTSGFHYPPGRRLSPSPTAVHIIRRIFRNCLSVMQWLSGSDPWRHYPKNADIAILHGT